MEAPVCKPHVFLQFLQLIILGEDIRVLVLLQRGQGFLIINRTLEDT